MLTFVHLKTLQALADRIIPADDFPSAWQAGVGDYLAGQFERDLRDKVELYCDGLDGLESEALQSAGDGFSALSPENQDILLHHIETGEVKTPWRTDPANFFRTVVAHVMEGYYSDPKNGGNRNGVAWQMIGFTGSSPSDHP
jgi:Gluconate 2-dehydrogenase subunit 3